MNEVTVGLLGLVIVLLLFMTGIEMGFAMITIGFLGFGYLISWHAAFNLLAKDFFDVVNTYGFTVIPLFILMGQVAFHSGAAKRLFDTSYKFIGHIPGGLAMTTVVAASTFKAICGSCPATAATFSSVAVPEMDRYHYDKRLSTGVVASVGTLGILLPPSVTLIVYGIITDLSIGRLFLAGIVPGLLTAFFFIAVIVGWCKINPKLGPKGERSTWAERFRSLPEVIWVVLIFLMVIGGILNGFFTPTEAGSVGTFLVLIFAFVRKDLNFKGYIQAGLESLRTACMVMMLIVGSVVLGHFITVTKIPMICADWVVTLQMPSWIIVLVISLIYIIGGSFIDDFAFMIIATPIFYPAITRLGYDPLWFGMLVCLTVMFGLVIPPMAIVVFIVSKITKTPLKVVYSGVYPFLLSIAVVAVLVFLFPPIATWLPGKLMP